MFPFTYRFAARGPCDSKGSECQCGIHTAEAASALRSRNKEGEAKQKPTVTSLQTCAPPCDPNSPPRPGEAPHPAPSARKSATQTAQKTALCAPASTQEVSESENRPATRGTAHSEVQGDARCTARCTTRCTARCTARCNDRPIAALHFLLPTGDSRSGRRSFDSKLNLPSPARRGSRSRPPLRRPRPLRFERLRVPVWNPYSRDRLGPAKSEDRKGGEGKTDANLTIFFSTCCAMMHCSMHRLMQGSTHGRPSLFAAHRR